MALINFKFNLAVVLCAALAMSGNCLADVTFDDGLSHTIDYSLTEYVFVNDGPAGQSTTVNVTQGAEVGIITVNQNSNFNMSGGHVDMIFWGNNTSAELSGNASIGNCYALDDASILIKDEVSILNFESLEAPSITIRGGHFYDNTIFGMPLLEISGGVFHHEALLTASNALVSGGVFEDGFSFRGDFDISGGSFSGGISLFQDTFATFIGSDFKINSTPADIGQPFDYLSMPVVDINSVLFFTFHLTGTLADGTALDQDVYISDGRQFGQAMPELRFVPEPCSFVLLSLAGAGFVYKRKNRA